MSRYRFDSAPSGFSFALDLKSYFKALRAAAERDKARVRWHLRGVESGLSHWWDAVIALHRCDAIPGAMTPFERYFIRKLFDSMLMDREPSPKQQALLWEIFAKVDAESAEPVRRRRAPSRSLP